MTPLAAYADRLSVRPGQTIRFHGAGAGGELTASIRRVVCADPNPEIGGVAVEPVTADVQTSSSVQPAIAPLGSYARIETRQTLSNLSSFTVLVTVKVTRMPRDGQAPAPILSWSDPTSGTGLALYVNAQGQVGFACGTEHRGSGAALKPNTWSRIAFVYDALKQRAELSVTDLSVKDGAGPPAATAFEEIANDFGSDHDLFIAGADGAHALSKFNGLVERPMVFARELSTGEISRVSDRGLSDDLIACWDFSQEISTNRVVDVGPNALDGRLVNTPARGMRGSQWSGREMCWRYAPEHYAAIHFHDDDIDDCKWPVIAEFTVPDDFKSGQYALFLDAGGHTENVPFWVVPQAGKPGARIAVLVSTFTYTVYGNHARPEWSSDPAWSQAWRDQSAAWNGYPHNPGDHHDLGVSTYNTHSDGSGISIASWHRPMLNVRVGYITYPYPHIRGSGHRHYPADTHLTMWLDAKGFDYDIITDWELHHEGYDLLKPYRVLLTGSHPEYHTREMLDALTAYRDNAGRFAYLGGNGFYWKIALSPDKDGVIEIRRAEGGIRAWAAAPGEYYNQFDGEYGGLWRRNGRPPQDLVGVGFSAQGNFVGSNYHVLPDARASRAAWILDGIDGETFGGHGFSGHGAAGFELDRADKALGTPSHAVVLASSQDHPPEAPWVLVPEERLTHLTTLPGGADADLIRADMVFFETAGGKGAVFSTGSITYCGSLPTNGFDNDVSRLTENVLRRFLDPAPFDAC